MDSKNGKDYGYNRKNTKPGNADKSSERFLEAHNRLQASVKKHLSASKGYDESSSEEDDLESETILGSVLKSYAQIGGKSEDLGRTQNFLEDTFQSGAATCLICIVTVKRNEAIWSCNKCFCFFHLQCIQRWSKDSIHYQKVALEERQLSISQIVWSCPKCRNEFSTKDIPKFYLCFCEKKENPEFQPWLVPHSCGDSCNKPLIPTCGHKCLLLCHPGPCPPCPNTVSSMCHCGKNGPRPQRCSNKNWSCGKVCGRKLKCNRHFCTDICHGDNCPPCPQKSKQSCQCAKNVMIRDCAEPLWSCMEICGKSLKCGYHSCKQICHKGDCGECPLTLPRQCPCGKTSLLLSCIEDVPTCKDTCGRTLDCGVHTCSQRCHKDKCGGCLERRIKKCRCGLHFKEIPCQKDYLCESKCKQIRDCNRHPCNRKCCDGSCSPCEKPCGRTLSCGNHKCTSICHQGQCYPCVQTEIVLCHCRGTKIIVPCGRKKKTRPPKCSKACKIPPDCHHDSREPHRCHFGSCPPCQKICGLVKGLCAHICKKKCHSAVLVDIHDGMRAIGPWEKVHMRL
uniref:PHD-type domain-containing protein n=1 Tax=Clastoptera arizonana TaxID=38151 RepID=A0A1B6CP89_9HEMI